VRRPNTKNGGREGRRGAPRTAKIPEDSQQKTTRRGEGGGKKRRKEIMVGTDWDLTKKPKKNPTHDIEGGGGAQFLWDTNKRRIRHYRKLELDVGRVGGIRRGAM